MEEINSKVKILKHLVMKMQKYLLPNELKISQEECQTIFKLRSKVTEVKINQRNSYEAYECSACGLEDESQEHVLECEKIIKM